MEHARYKTRSSSAMPRPRQGRPILLHTPNGLEVPLVSQSTVFPKKLRQTPLTWGTISKATIHFHGSGCTLPHLSALVGWASLTARPCPPQEDAVLERHPQRLRKVVLLTSSQERWETDPPCSRASGRKAGGEAVLI